MNGIKICCIVILTDDYTNKSVDSKNIQIQTKPFNQYVSKENGTIVFLECGNRTFTVILQSQIYQQQRIVLKGTAHELSGPSACPIHHIRLFPTRYYPFTSESLVLEYHIEPYQKILLIPKHENMPCKLSEDAKSGSRFLRMNFRKWEESAGMRLFLRNADGQEEHVRIKIRDQNGDCQLEQAIIYAYQKRNTKIYQAYLGSADGKGTGILVGKADAGQTCLCEIKVFHKSISSASTTETELVPGMNAQVLYV